MGVISYLQNLQCNSLSYCFKTAEAVLLQALNKSWSAIALAIALKQLKLFYSKHSIKPAVQ
jgi:hypothetical protein